MDFSLKKENISNIVSVYDSNISQNIDSDITLPEYVDDIETVLNCFLTGEIETSSFNDGRITVEGYALIRLIYTSKNGTLHCFESTVPFSRFADAQNVEANDCLSISACTQYVNCRLVNPRRFDIHGNIVISVKASRITNQSVINSVEGAGLQARCRTVEVSNACAVSEKAFSLSEVLELSEDSPSIAQIISINASPDLSETKLISQKALVKGDMTLDVYYIADDKQDKVCCAQFTLPISQIVETEGGDEGCCSQTSVTVCSVNYTVRADSLGAIRLLDVSVGARAKVSVFKNEEIQIISDAYSTEYEIECERKNIQARCLKDQFSDTCLCRTGFSSTGKEIANVLSLLTRELTSNTSRRDGKLIINGTVRAGLIIEYSDGEKGYIEKTLEYEYSREEGNEEFICEKSVRVNASSFLVTSPTNIDVRVEIEIEACVFKEECLAAITDIAVKEDCKKTPCRAAITLYYPNKDESIWDIAKRYNTTVTAITEENRLEEGAGKCRMLMIPRM